MYVETRRLSLRDHAGIYINKRANAQRDDAKGADLGAERQSSFLISFCAAMAERGR
jgi:hypothetical protein